MKIKEKFSKNKPNKDEIVNIYITELFSEKGIKRVHEKIFFKSLRLYDIKMDSANKKIRYKIHLYDKTRKEINMTEGDSFQYSISSDMECEGNN